LEVVVQADTNRALLLQEQEQVEQDLEQGAQRLEQILLEWNAIDGDVHMAP
jgi:hypothetical protein